MCNDNLYLTEARIEQAKRIQRNNSDYIKVDTNDYKTNSTSSKSIGLIPIQRLPIPHCSESMSQHEQYPLVEYWQSDSTERYKHPKNFLID